MPNYAKPRIKVGHIPGKKFTYIGVQIEASSNCTISIVLWANNFATTWLFDEISNFIKVNSAGYLL